MNRRKVHGANGKPARGAWRALLCAVTVVVAPSCGCGEQSAPPSAKGKPSTALCVDGEGRRYSSGAVKQFDGGLKRCDPGGRWVSAAPAASQAGRNPRGICLDEQGRRYSTGAERQVGKNRVRCDVSGQWVPMRPLK